MSDQPYVLKAGDTMTGTLDIQLPGPGTAITTNRPIQAVNTQIQSFGDGSPTGGGFEARDASFTASRGDFFIGGSELGHGFGWGLRGENGGLYRSERGITIRTDPASDYVYIETNTGQNRRVMLDNENGVIKSGGVMTGALLLYEGEPQLPNEAMSKRWVDAGLDTKLSLSGGTLSGGLNVNGDIATLGANRVIVGSPSAANAVVLTPGDPGSGVTTIFPTGADENIDLRLGATGAGVVRCVSPAHMDQRLTNLGIWDGQLDVNDIGLHLMWNNPAASGSSYLVNNSGFGTIGGFQFIDAASAGLPGEEQLLSIQRSGITAFRPVTLPADPDAPMQAATKQYVDALAARIEALEQRR